MGYTNHSYKTLCGYRKSPQSRSNPVDPQYRVQRLACRAISASSDCWASCLNVAKACAISCKVSFNRMQLKTTNKLHYLPTVREKELTSNWAKFTEVIKVINAKLIWTYSVDAEWQFADDKLVDWMWNAKCVSVHIYLQVLIVAIPRTRQQ